MEELAKLITTLISHAVEIAAAVIIGLALLRMLYRWAWSNSRKTVIKESLRIEFGSAVALALELLLGADVLATAVAPSWDDIGKLSAIAALRTALNHFLGKELHEIQETKKINDDAYSSAGYFPDNHAFLPGADKKQSEARVTR